MTLPTDTITVSFCPLHGQQITDSPDCPVTMRDDYCREVWLHSTRYAAVPAVVEYARRGPRPLLPEDIEREFGGAR